MRPTGAYFSQSGEPMFIGAGAYFSQDGSTIYSGAGESEQPACKTSIPAILIAGVAGLAVGWMIYDYHLKDYLWGYHAYDKSKESPFKFLDRNL